DRIVTNAGARPGDALVLTKPIGTGVLTTALKRDLLSQVELAPAVAAMTTLNAAAARAMLAVGVHAATDVTGFGLLGHLHSLLEASGVAAEVTAQAIPLLPHSRDMAAGGAVPGGTQRNLTGLPDPVSLGAGVEPTTPVPPEEAATAERPAGGGRGWRGGSRWGEASGSARRASCRPARCARRRVHSTGGGTRWQPAGRLGLRAGGGAGSTVRQHGGSGVRTGGGRASRGRRGDARSRP